MADAENLFAPGFDFSLDEVINDVMRSDDEELADSPAGSPDKSVQKAKAWLDGMNGGGPMPSNVTAADVVGWVQGFLQLKKRQAVFAVSATPTPAATPAYRLVQIDTPSTEFPQMLDLGVPGQKPISASQHTSRAWLAEVEANPTATWVQTKTKFTRIIVELQDPDGNPVKGSDVQPGGLKLQMTLHKCVGNDAESLLKDADNSREKRLFAGTAGGYYNTEVNMLETRNEFKFKVLCLSNDIQKSAVRLQVAPTHPDYADRKELIMTTKSFNTRAADKAYLDKPGAKAATGTKRARAEGKAPSPPLKMQLTPSLTVDDEEYRNCEGVLKSEYDPPNYRGAFDDDDDDDDDDEDVAAPEEEVDLGEAVVPEDARISDPAARAALRRLLAEAESGKVPSGKQLAEALLACRISA